MTVRKAFIVTSIAITLLVLTLSIFWKPILISLFVILPIIAVGIKDMTQRTKTILRLYPVVGHFRYLLEYIRPEIQQYFIESDTNGKPISREYRSLVYQRAKGVRDTQPFGTVFDVYRLGYEWINHSLSPHKIEDKDPRIIFGAKTCTKPYAASPSEHFRIELWSIEQKCDYGIK